MVKFAALPHDFLTILLIPFILRVFKLTQVHKLCILRIRSKDIWILGFSCFRFLFYNYMKLIKLLGPPAAVDITALSPLELPQQAAYPPF